jgi:hypothetical protein
LYTYKGKQTIFLHNLNLIAFQRHRILSGFLKLQIYLSDEMPLKNVFLKMSILLLKRGVCLKIAWFYGITITLLSPQ